MLSSDDRIACSYPASQPGYCLRQNLRNSNGRVGRRDLVSVGRGVIEERNPQYDLNVGAAVRNRDSACAVGYDKLGNVKNRVADRRSGCGVENENLYGLCTSFLAMWLLMPAALSALS